MPSTMEFSTARPRPLPVFVLADTSQSMRGAKIDTLNRALADMRATLADVAGARSDIELCVIAFGGTDASVAVPLCPAADIVLPTLSSSGHTPMGAAFRLLLSLVEDDAVLSRRAYSPAFVLVSDGLPTDIPAELADMARRRTATREDFLGWPDLHALHTAPRSARAMRLAIGIGDNANHEMLHAFVDTPGTPVIAAKDAGSIERFIQWVTLSVTARSASANPNEAFLAAMSVFNDDEVRR